MKGLRRNDVLSELLKLVFKFLSQLSHSLFLISYFKFPTIFSCAAFSISGVTFIFWLVKFKSLALLIGMRCKCACGTSSPTTEMPQRLHAKDFSMACAMGLANTSILER